MKHNKGVLGHLLDATNLESDLMPGLPILELFGTSRLLIENHISVVEYSNSMICIKMPDAYVKISGKELLLSKLAAESLVVTGDIDQLTFLKHGG